jgi:GR25 family glycosyltransferase involved in LPS biosynthesis
VAGRADNEGRLARGSRAEMAMTGIDHGFCINLDRRPDRRAAFYDRLPAPLHDLVERVPAVDGRDLAMTPDLRALFEENDFHFRRNIIGCSLSHYRLWQLIASADYPYDRTLIFEDDVWFSCRFLALWNGQMAPRLPPDFDLIYLGGPLGPAMVAEMVDLMDRHDGHIDIPLNSYMASRENESFVRPQQVQFCTYSYIVSRNGARKLCDLVERDKFERSIDWFMIDRWPEMNVYATDPLLCWAVFQEGSDILLDFETFEETPKVKNHA